MAWIFSWSKREITFWYSLIFLIKVLKECKGTLLYLFLFFETMYIMLLNTEAYLQTL